MSMTDWCELKMLQALAEAVPDMYLALFTASPAEDGTGGAEVSGDGYARPRIPFGAPATDAGGGTCMANLQPFNFPTAQSAWGTVSAWGVFDVETGGHLLWVQDFDTPRAVPAGSVVAVREGDVYVSAE